MGDHGPARLSGTFVWPLVVDTSVPGLGAPGVSTAPPGRYRIRLHAWTPSQLRRAAEGSPESIVPLRSVTEETAIWLDEIGYWADVISHRPPLAIQRDLAGRLFDFGGAGHRPRYGWPIHRIERGYGPIGLDYFAVRVTRLPLGDDGQQMTAEQLLNYLRTHINEFLDTTATSFAPYDPVDATKWTSSDPLGTVFAIAFPPDSGSVVCSLYEPQRWRFSTLRTPRDLDHPLSGSREFGFTREPEGSYLFYTRAADRPTGLIDWALTDVIYNGVRMNWSRMQVGLAAFVTARLGAATVLSPRAWLDDWPTVRDRYWRPTTPWLEEDL